MPPVSPEMIAAAGNSLSSFISGITGIFQRAKGRKLLRGLSYPVEQMPEEITQNQKMAQQMASTGMPSEQYSQAMRNIQRQQMNAIRAAGDRRGALGAIANIQQGTNDATLNLDAQNAAMKQANQKTLMNVNNTVANWKSDLYDKNIRQKYMRDYNYAQSLIGAGNQNFTNGVGDLATSAGLFTYGLSNKNNQQAIQ